MQLDTTGLKPLDASGLTPVASDAPALDISGLKPLDVTGLKPASAAPAQTSPQDTSLGDYPVEFGKGVLEGAKNLPASAMKGMGAAATGFTRDQRTIFDRIDAEEARRHPDSGRPILQNADGSVATEESITVVNPRLNGGKPTNIPSIWNGQRPPFAPGSAEFEDWAVAAALKSGQPFQAFNTIDEAVAIARQRSADLGRQLAPVSEIDDPVGYRHMTPEQRAAARSQIDTAAAVPLTQSPLYRAGEAVEEFGKETLAPAPGFEGSWTRDIGSGFGSMAAGIGLSLVPHVGPFAAQATFFGAGQGEAVDRAVQKGATEEQAIQAARLGTIPGATDALDMLLPQLGSTGRALGFIKRVGLRALEGAVLEGGQEGVQQLLQNAIAQGVYNPEQDLLEDVPRSVAIGAIVGGATSGGFAAVERQQPAQAQPQDQPVQQPGIPAGAFPAETLLPADPVNPAYTTTVNSPAAPIGAPLSGGGVSPDSSGGIAPPQAGPPAPAGLPGHPVELDPRGLEPLPPPSTRPMLEELLADPRPVDEIRAEREATKLRGLVDEEIRETFAGAYMDASPGESVLDTAIDSVRAEIAAGQPTAPNGAPWADVLAELERRKREEPHRDATINAAGDLVPRQGTRRTPVQLEAAGNPNLGAEQTVQPKSMAQAEAGNYRKRHVKWHGIEGAVETEAGQERTGIGADGVPWSVMMEHPYGEFKRTEGKDGDPVDFYIGPHPESDRAVVIDQIDPDTRKFDEHKVIVGVLDGDQALDVYTSGFSDGSASHRVGAAVEMSAAELRAWLEQGDTKKPLAYKNPPVDRSPKGPLSLFQFLAKRGGIQDHGGELRNMGLDRAFVPGFGRLVRGGGMTLDRAREAAVEAGYLFDAGAVSGGNPDSFINDLLDALDDEARGTKVYSARDVEAAQARESQRQEKANAEELARAVDETRDLAKSEGINATDKEIEEAARYSLVNGTDLIDGLVTIIERSYYAAHDEVVALDTQEQGYEQPAATFSGRSDQEGAGSAPAGEQSAGPQAAAAPEPAARGEQPGPAQQPGSEARPVAPPPSNSVEKTDKVPEGARPKQPITVSAQHATTPAEEQVHGKWRGVASTNEGGRLAVHAYADTPDAAREAAKQKLLREFAERAAKRATQPASASAAPAESAAADEPIGLPEFGKGGERYEIHQALKKLADGEQIPSQYTRPKLLERGYVEPQGKGKKAALELTKLGRQALQQLNAAEEAETSERERRWKEIDDRIKQETRRNDGESDKDYYRRLLDLHYDRSREEDTASYKITGPLLSKMAGELEHLPIPVEKSTQARTVEISLLETPLGWSYGTGMQFPTIGHAGSASVWPHRFAEDANDDGYWNSRPEALQAAVEYLVDGAEKIGQFNDSVTSESTKRGARRVAVILREWLKGQLKNADDRKAPETGPSDSGSAPDQTVVDNEPSIALARVLVKRLEAGEPITAKILQDEATKAHGGTLAEGKFDRKDAHDALELAVNMYIRDTRHLRADSPNARQAFKMLDEFLAGLPTQRVRSDEMVAFDQFSTPPNYALAAVYAANLRDGDLMIEPQAGTGSLVAAASMPGVRIVANELSKRRAALLRALLGKDGQVFTENAEQLDNVLPDNIKPTVVVMNPPFSQTAGRMGDKKVPMTPAVHIEAALKRLEPGGRLVAIVGRGMTMGSPTFRAWWGKIGGKYTVVANIGVAGGAFEKYGTTFGTRLVVIDKVQAPADHKPVLVEAQTVEDLMRALEPIRDARPQAAGAAREQRDVEPSRVTAAEGSAGGRATAQSASSQSGSVGSGEPSVSDSGAGGSPSIGTAGGDAVRVEAGKRDGVAVDQSERAGESGAGATPAGRFGDGNKPVGSGTSSSRRDLEPSGGGQSGASASSERVGLEQVAPGKQGASEISESLYQPYEPARVRVKGAKPHPGPLVESASMASVAPPPATYSPHLPKAVIENGLLSLAQLETTVYAGQAHSKMLPAGDGEKPMRRGFFIGDGTGVGKGREIAGIILDNFQQGRKKAIWVSEKQTLLTDAKRDWGGLEQNANLLFNAGKVKTGEPIGAANGIGFITYDTLKGGMSDQEAIARGGFVRKQKVSVNGQSGAVSKIAPGTKGKPAQITVALDNGTPVTVPANEVTAIETTTVKSRVDQLVDWVGEDFDGVIAFDEAHNMGNAATTKGDRGFKDAAQKALAGIALQDRLPNARVVYVSATGATEVSNLAYANRLGLWGRGTPFASRDKFVADVEEGGIAAMELIARDMKQLGLYTARNLSYDGVEYARVEHKLDANQREIYDTLAEAWQTVLRNIEEALEETGGNKDARAKSAAKSAFWGAHQRFFNQVISSMQMPSVIEAVEKDLAEGRQVVLQLTNTNEASQERAAAKATTAEQIEDLDITPRDQIIQLVERSFPTQEYEQYTEEVDGKAKVRSRPVVDSNGEPVQNKQAVRMKEELIERLASIRVPQGPLDMVLDHFGVDVVAEVTGRGRRFVLKPDEKTGERKRVEESRPGSANLAETDAYQAGKKKILIFSEAGGTGRSYHADNTAPSKNARRVHYLVQGGWRADKAVQGFGRTHRTNQASAPIVKLVTTDLQGQKRFISSIARRLSQLGALTKGQRQAGDQGIFSARDNLESAEAMAALRQFYTDLLHDNIKGVSINEFEEQTGLTLRNKDEEGRVLGTKEDLPPITQFLNRLLSLKIDMQNRVFDAFSERLDRVIEARQQAGLLDVGLETVKADKIVKETEKVVHTIEDTSAETKHVKFTLSDRFVALDFDEIADSKNRPIKFFVRSPKGKVYAVAEASSLTDAKGKIVDYYRLINGVSGSHVVERANVDTGKNWDRIDRGAAEKLWKSEIDSAPEFISRSLHLITGAILPIWDRLKGSARVVRLQDDSGEQFIGRVVPNARIADTLRALGAEADAPKVTPESLHAALSAGGRATLSNGWVLKRVRVANEQRIELTGPSSFSEGTEVKKDGAFTERIDYKVRYFVPTSLPDGPETLQRLTQYRPVVELTEANARPSQMAAGDEDAMFKLRTLNMRAPFTDEFTEQREKVYPLLRRELDRLGLTQIALKLPDTIEAYVDGKTVSADGHYLRGVISLALDGDNKFNTLHHEAVHAMRRFGLFKDGEWAILTRMAKARWFSQHDVARDYLAWPQDKQIEEAIARAYADWASGNKTVDGRVARLFKRIRDFLEAIANALRGAGFKTAEGIFRDIKAGDVGARLQRRPTRQNDEISIETGRDGVIMVKDRNESGHLLLTEKPEAFKVGISIVSRAERGTGLGLKLYEAAIEHAAANGKPLRSDAFLSANSAAVYERLKRMGYDVKRHPAAHKAEKGGWAADSSSGWVYEVKARDVAYAVRSADGDLFKSEIVQTPDGPREQLVIPGAERISDRQRAEREGAKPKRSGKAQKTVDGLPLFDGEQDPGLPLFSLRREPETAIERERTMQGFLARGQYMDRALRVPFDIFGGVTRDGVWKPGVKLFDKASSVITKAEFSPEGRFAFLNPLMETARTGLVDRYNLRDMPEYVDRERKRSLDERAVMMEGAEILKNLKAQGVGREEARVLQAILTGEDVSAADMENLSEPIRAAIDQLGQEAVALGQVSPESYERNRGTYLHRVYQKYESEQSGLSRLVNSIMGSKRKKIIGDQLKGRGLFVDIDVPRLMKDVPGWNEAARGTPQKGEAFILLDELPAQGALELNDDATKVKPLRRIYWPAETAIPDRYRDFRNQGMWEVRFVAGNKVTLWRDFTKAERTQMGEILDARYTIGKTFMLMAHDLANGRFYKDIAENEAWTRSMTPNAAWVDASEWSAQGRRYKGKGEIEWVKVPEAEIPNTGGKKRWGALSGKWVREEIWRDLNELQIMQRPNLWRTLLTQWKLNKTARSPVVHMNNVMSNFILMDMVDVRFQDFAAGIRSYLKGDEAYQEAFANGAFGADMMSQEVRDQVLKPILEELERDNTYSQGGRLGSLGQVSKFTESLWSKIKKLDQKMINAYRLEDEIFRMATYMRRRQLGDDPKQAADVAREQFIDYDVRAPWVNAARNTVLPFITYTYRAAPMVARAIATRPWKLGKYFLLAYMLNALAYALTGDDDETAEERAKREDRERRSLREQEDGRAWIGTPRMLRLPLNDRHNNPLFLDVRRWVPASDIFDTQGNDMPAWLNLGGPLMIGAELFLNRSAFTGESIVNTKTDDIWDRMGKRGDHLYKSWMPSAAWVPGSWYFDKIGNAVNGATDTQGRPYSTMGAISNSFGIKVKPQDVEDGLRWKAYEFSKVEQELASEARRLARRRDRNLISESEFNRAMNDIATKRTRLGEKRRKTLD